MHEQATELHTFTCNAPVESLVVVGDESRLERALANLLSNAVKYSPDGGRVEVDLDELGRTAVLRVHDEGIGIPVRDLPRVFDRFHRATNVGETPGTGIGLADVRQVIEQHGGSVAIESGGPGWGTTVTARLPLPEDPPSGSDL